MVEGSLRHHARRKSWARLESNRVHCSGSTRNDEQHDGPKRLYVLDESSLASTKQMNEFLHRLRTMTECYWWASAAAQASKRNTYSSFKKLEFNGTA